ncbi:flagellar protein FlaG [Azonexus fungiphilus]|uniref:flagellar protein FlaG n=1 Tax=Azonexus fungiphilus TaxID=146940 RepID=UPI00156AF986|nr:flagellar protein FlaG [Azonexus fungiphilus]NHC07255.1 flagellar protein FlaG [Azonexus fungiphilus]
MNIESVSAANSVQRQTSQERPQTIGSTTTVQQTVSNTQESTKQNSRKATSEELQQAVQRLSEFVAPNQSDINFSIDDSTGANVVKIVDRSSREVLRQIPSEEALALAQALDKLQGLLIKDKA